MATHQKDRTGNNTGSNMGNTGGNHGSSGQGGNFGNHGGNQGGNTGTDAGGIATMAPAAVTEFAGKATDAVKDAASTVAEKTSQAGSYIAHKAEDATSAVGSQIGSLATAIRDKGPHEGMLGNASEAVASTLESCGRELQEHGLSGIADDVTNTIRRHPVPAILCGIGVGFLLARMCSK